jgi:uncharacterized membrane protein YidH (DUF202 family)
MKKQTAVEWLVEQVNSDCTNSVYIRKELIDKAKEMEKETNIWYYISIILVCFLFVTLILAIFK